MSTLTWLHLSDWHQGAPDSDRDKILQELLEDIEQREERVHSDLKDLDFAIFSGDIAWSGLPDQYSAAMTNLFRPLMAAAGWPIKRSDSIFLVPGNHDIDWNALKDVPAAWVNEITDAKSYEDCRHGVRRALSKSRRHSFLDPFQSYLDFVAANFTYTAPDPSELAGFWQVHNITLHNMKVAVICLNSSWLCGRHKDADGKVSDYGKLILGELQADKAFQQTKAADIFIGVMHHPLNWLKESDRNRIQEILSQKCDFILHGHEHRPGINVLESILGDVITIPAGAAWDRRYQDDPRYVSAYNFVHIDLEKREGTIFLREWNDEAHAWDKDDGLWPEGQYRFSLPARDAERSSEARDAARRVKHRFLRALGRRFLEDMEVHVRHVLEKHGNLQVVREVARFKIRVRAGQKETLCIKEDKNGALQAAVKQSGLDLCTCTFSYFKVMGQPITPMRDDDECTVHICKLAYGEQDIEFERTKYYPDRGSSSFVTGRFCKRFKIRFKREKRLDYEFHSLGGFPKLDPCPNEILDVEEVVVEDLCFSDQGYLIQWFPPTTRKVSRSRKAGVIP